MRWVRHVAGAISSAASAAANSASNAAASSPARSRWNASSPAASVAVDREAWLRPQRRRERPVEPSPLSRQRCVVGDLTDERVPNPIGVRRSVHDEQSGIPAPRTAASVVASSSSTTAARSAGSVSRPTVASATRTCRPAGSRLATSASRRSDSITGIASPARCATASSSVKNGLPSPRRGRLVHQRGRRGTPSTAATCTATAFRSRPANREPLDGAHPAELGDPTTQRGISRDLVGAVGTDEHDPLVQEVASEVLEEIPRRRIAPVKVVEAHEDRTVGAELADGASANASTSPTRPVADVARSISGSSDGREAASRPRWT